MKISNFKNLKHSHEISSNYSKYKILKCLQISKKNKIFEKCFVVPKTSPSNPVRLHGGLPVTGKNRIFCPISAKNHKITRYRHKRSSILTKKNYIFFKKKAR